MGIKRLWSGPGPGPHIVGTGLETRSSFAGSPRCQAAPGDPRPRAGDTQGRTTSCGVPQRLVAGTLN